MRANTSLADAIESGISSLSRRFALLCTMAARRFYE